jgi:hypothetical protein
VGPDATVDEKISSQIYTVSWVGARSNEDEVMKTNMFLHPKVPQRPKEFCIVI